MSCGFFGFGRVLGEGKLALPWLWWLRVDIGEVKIGLAVSTFSSVFGLIFLELLVELLENGIIALDKMSLLMNRIYLLLVHLLIFRAYLLF